jgi:magnesium transporter
MTTVHAITPLTNTADVETNFRALRKKSYPTQVKVFVYDANRLDVYTLDDLLKQKIQKTDEQVLWVQVTGLETVALIQSIGVYFNFHSLAIEDTLKPCQRAKVDGYDNYQFITSKLLEQKKHKIHDQQLSIFLGENYVVSFLESESILNDVFDKNLQNKLSRLRLRKCDYLAYELLDYATDTIFPILSENSNRLDQYENKIMDDPSEKVMRSVQFFKRDLRHLRQFLWANHDMLSSLMRNELDLISPTTSVFIRDCYDHAIRQMDLLESQRECAVSLVDIYLSSVTNRLGQVMKILTGISIIFMPPTFLAAVWGMNFKNMPELTWAHGYAFAWIIMLISSIIPSIWFWRKGWLRVKEQ